MDGFREVGWEKVKRKAKNEIGAIEDEGWGSK